LYAQSNLQFRISYNATGTNTSTFYIDNFQVANRAVLSAKPRLTEAFNLNVVPNPSMGSSVITFTAQTSDLTTISVQDISGRTMGTIDFSPVVGNNQIQLSDVAKQLKAGVYMLRLTNGNAVQVRKFVAAE
jgi:hypothetical protein